MNRETHADDLSLDISRTIVPLVNQHDVCTSAGEQTGIGDIWQSAFFAPKALRAFRAGGVNRCVLRTLGPMGRSRMSCRFVAVYLALSTVARRVNINSLENWFNA